jgi:hypothetical protein
LIPSTSTRRKINCISTFFSPAILVLLPHFVILGLEDIEGNHANEGCVRWRVRFFPLRAGSEQLGYAASKDTVIAG